MIVFPNAKINLGLNVVAKRSDGYHNLETVFLPIPLYDVLELTLNHESDEPYVFTCSGLVVDTPPENNICIKAFNLIARQFTIPPVKLHLHKAIPFGAGLGGGSADAAFMLKLLNAYFKLNISPDKLESMAAQLGADCPFFIGNRSSYATGIGDVLTPVPVNLTGHYLALVKPNTHVSTVVAYSGIVPTPSKSSLLGDINHPISRWKDLLKNDFESSVFQKFPELELIKTQLYELGAEYASMSGSGSTLFGIFKEEPTLDFPGMFTFCSKLK